MNTDLLTPGQAAAIAGVTVRTLQRYADHGRLEYVALPSGHRRYPREAVEALAATTVAEQVTS